MFEYAICAVGAVGIVIVTFEAIIDILLLSIISLPEYLNFKFFSILL